MTNGTKTVDNQVVQTLSWSSPNGDCGSGFVTGKVGSKSTISWSGANSTAVKVSQRSYIARYRVFNSDGSVRAVKKHRMLTPRKKYSLAKTENAYLKTVSVAVDGWGVNRGACHSQNDYAVPYPSYLEPNYAGNQQSPWNANEDIALLGKIRSKMGAEFDLTVFLGEGKEALHTIADVATRVYRSLKQLKRGNVVSAVRILSKGIRSSGSRRISKKDASDRYLEWTYAVAPLLQDVDNAVQHLAYTLNRPLQQSVRVSRKAEAVGTIPIGGPSQRASVSWLVRKSIICRIDAINEAALVGLTDPAAVAWEVTPWSFVADWFIPVGNYLQALNLQRSLHGIFITSTLDVKKTFNFRSDWPDGTEKLSVDFLRTDVRFERTIGSSLARPDLPSVKPFGKSASFKHAMNATALLVSTFSGKWSPLR
jgi:hypothetical protein